MKKALVIVDYQNDFVNGALGFPGAEMLDEIITKKLESAIEENIDIIFTFDTHTEDYLQSQEGKRLPVEHCIKGTKGHEIYGKTSEFLKQAKKVIYKPSFASMELGDYLKQGGYDDVELCGLVSNICVISNAVIAKAALPEGHIVIDAKATASFDNKLNEEALDVAQGLQIDVINRKGC